MDLHWMHLLPVDRYFVRTNSIISESDQEILTLLYQPLIGSLAHSLYLCLLSELERDQFTSKETTHKTLMTMMGIHLDKIFEERKKLEGIGLLNVYKKKGNEEITYLYELHKPFSPVEFFKDDVLSVYLYNRVGKNRYLQLRERFTLDKLNKEEYKETTVSFSDVFTSLHHSEISAKQGELASALEIDKNSEIISNKHESNYEIAENSFDFSLLTVHLSNMIDPQKLLTDKVKDMIVRLAFLYRTDPLEMSRIIQDSLLQDDTVDLDVMREKVKRWYRFTYESEPPALGLRTHPEEYRTMVGISPSNEEEETILYYETESPLTLLENKSPSGMKVPLSDVKIVESLLLDYKLLPGVANVLIEYVLEINDMNLTKAFVEKIAAQWARKNIKQVKKAMELAKSELRKRDEWKQAAKETTATKDKPNMRTNNNRYVRKDRLPKWLTEEKKAVSVEYDGDIEKLKAELDQKMKQFKSQGEV